jgi:cation transport ATPase
VVLMEDNLRKLVAAIDTSRDAVSLVQNYTLIAAVNTLALALAIPSGLVTPDFLGAVE